jgi:ribonuclease G
MSSDILINVTLDEVRVGLLEDGQLVEFYVERKKESSLVGNIYKGKVVKILPGMQSAFIEAGLEKAAFLYVDDIKSETEDFSHFLVEDFKGIEIPTRKASRDVTISELIQEGQDIIVQITKDPISTKGARCSTYITIPGRYLVLMPTINHIGISRRISDESERTRLKALVDEIIPDGYGLIIRTASENAGVLEFKHDLEFLLMLWQNIQKKKDFAVAPSLLYSDLDLIHRSARDLLSCNVDRLIIDSPKEYENIRDYAKDFFPELLSRIELYKDSEPIFDTFGVEIDVSKGLDRKIWLKSGGNIIIDQTEAMSIIDINTGKYVGKEDLEDTILKTNLEAVKEIAYQIRLRNLGGIIIIDFIDMERPENKDRLYNAFVEAMKKDRARNTILNITELGLIQMTRKRIRESLGRTLCDVCPCCEGKGCIKSSKTISYEIIRKLKKSSFKNISKVTITVHPTIADYLFDEHRLGLEEFEVTNGVEILIKTDSRLHQESFDIMFA